MNQFTLNSRRQGHGRQELPLTRKLLIGLLLTLSCSAYAMDLDPDVMYQQNTQDMSKIKDLYTLARASKNGEQIHTDFVHDYIASLSKNSPGYKLWLRFCQSDSEIELLGILPPEKQMELGRKLYDAWAKEQPEYQKHQPKKEKPLSNKPQVEEVKNDDNEAELNQPTLAQQPNTIPTNFFANHKGKFIAMGVLGTLVAAGYKLFGPFTNQAQKLEGMVKNAKEMVNDASNAQEISINVKRFTRLNAENQDALQTKITAFNIILEAVKADKQDNTALQQAFNQLKATADQCIQQINEHTANNPSVWTTLADKCKAFGSAVKYYAWDKWKAKKASAQA